MKIFTFTCHQGYVICLYFRYLNDVEIEESEHFQISCKENEYLYRLDIVDCNNDHFGKVKIVAKNENGESEKEVIFSVLKRFYFL